MSVAGTPLEWLALVERELLLFAGVFFLIGLIDELVMDLLWIRLRLTGQARTLRIDRKDFGSAPLRGPAALFIPAWKEERVVATTVAHVLRAWPHADLRVYVGCYRNDAATAAAIVAGAQGDPRVRLVVNDRDGPTTKGDCLNRLYATMEADERRTGRRFRMVLQQDAEDMVDPAALGLLDAALENAEFVQLPVLPEPQLRSRWIGSHYCEEFAEAHGKAMVVRSALGVALPGAGVGCAFSRELLGAMDARRADGPFPADSLTEDYELGLTVKAAGGRALFLRARGDDGRLVATRACFPASFRSAVRQKARWVHGIAFQGWDRLGWSDGPAEWWMRLRDRRGPLAALVLFVGYMMFALGLFLLVAGALGYPALWRPNGLLQIVLWADGASFVWRMALRFAFTAREYGLREGVRAVARVPLANLIAIMAGRRALAAYIASLCGAKPQWDKTHHDAHPLHLAASESRA